MAILLIELSMQKALRLHIVKAPHFTKPFINEVMRIILDFGYYTACTALNFIDTNFLDEQWLSHKNGLI